MDRFVLRAGVGALALGCLTLVLQTGCSSCQDQPPGAGEPAAGVEQTGTAVGAAKTGEAPPAPADTGAPKGFAAGLDMSGAPDMVLGVAGVSSFRDAVALARKSAETVMPGQLPPDMASELLESLKEMLGMKDIAWMATDKPLRLVVVDPKRFPGAGALVMPIADRAALDAALPEDAQRDTLGHAWVYKVGDGLVQLDFVDPFVVATLDPALFEAIAAFVRGPVVAWEPVQPMAVVAHMANVRRAFGEELAEAKKTMIELQEELARQQQPGLDSPELAAGQIEMIFGLVETTAEITLAAIAEGDEVRLGLGVTGLDGSALASVAGALAGRSTAFASAVSPTAWMALAGSMDVAGIKGIRDLQEMGVKAWAGLLELGPEDTTRLSVIADKLFQASGGEFMEDVRTIGSFPVAFSALVRSKKPELLREANDELLAFFYDKASKRLIALAKEEGFKLETDQISSFTQLLEVFNESLAAHGVKGSVIDEDKDGTVLRAFVVDADWNKLGLEDEEPGLLAEVERVVGRHIELAEGFQGDLLAVGMGPSAVADVRKLLAGERSGGEANLNRVIEGQAMAMSLRLGPALEAFAWLPELAEMKDRIAAMPKDEAVTVALSSDGKQIFTSFGVPLALLGGLVKLAD